MSNIDPIIVRAPATARSDEILSAAALDFVARLHRRFNAKREQLLKARAELQAALSAGATLGFMPGTGDVRKGDWQVAPLPPDLRDRRVEITGPVDRKLMINALNSGAKVFMADFEDACSPTWANMMAGQANLIDVVERRIEYENGDGRRYRLSDSPATLMVRPRGWHLPERHLLVDGEVVSGSLFDFGLFVFHNGARLLERGSGPYFYLPKLERHLEARLWNDVFTFAEQTLNLTPGSIKATVLIETIPAAFQMDEILYELREHSAGLNAGRWDYIFSLIKRFHVRPEFVLPDREKVTMTVPFMRAYCDLLVRTCHRRGAPAIGGMAAFIPNRQDEAVTANALAKVREDKEREARAGFDGTWVAHPDLVSVVMEVFERELGAKPNQIGRPLADLRVTPEALLDVRMDGTGVTERGLRTNVRVTLHYLASWLGGEAAVAIDNLMEDAATAEIARAQVWQWVRHGVTLQEGPPITPDLVRRIAAEEERGLRSASRGGQLWTDEQLRLAAALFEHVALGDDFVEFLTLPAYSLLVRDEEEHARKAA